MPVENLSPTALGEGGWHGFSHHPKEKDVHVWSKHGHDDGWTNPARVKYSFLRTSCRGEEFSVRKTCSRHAPSMHSKQVQGPGTPSRTFHLESTAVCSLVIRHSCLKRTKRIDNQVRPECGLHHPGITSVTLLASVRTNTADGNVGQHREETVCVQGGRPSFGTLASSRNQDGPVFGRILGRDGSCWKVWSPKVRRGI